MKFQQNSEKNLFLKILCSKNTLQIYSLKFPSVLKKEINNIHQLEVFLKKEKITSFLIGPGAGSGKKIKGNY